MFTINANNQQIAIRQAKAMMRAPVVMQQVNNVDQNT
jgi:hypothetical protein